MPIHIAQAPALLAKSLPLAFANFIGATQAIRLREHIAAFGTETFPASKRDNRMLSRRANFRCSTPAGEALTI